MNTARRNAQLAILLGSVLAATTVMAAPDISIDVATRSGAAMSKGLAYLVASQRPDGAWEAFGNPHPAITALAVNALAKDKAYGPDHPAVKRGIAFVLKFVQEDGGIYTPGQGHLNYETSVALMALAAVNSPEHKKALVDAQNFLKKLQWDEGEGHEANSSWYGGAGYGNGKRPDLSNTQLMIEALRESGLPADDPVYKKALKFVERCQLLDETNDQKFADGTSEGGFVYSPANDGESKAGTETTDTDTHLRSYGTMTYAGFKSMLYAKLSHDDPRVKAAYKWIEEHYTLDANPNMPGEQAKEGLYYYYHTFARALLAWGESTIKDDAGVPCNWRNDLCEKLIDLQKPDGSWVNETDRWYEGNPHLVTAYAVLAMQAALSE